MSAFVELQLPPMQGLDEKQGMMTVQRYLFTLANDLNYALGQIDGGIQDAQKQAAAASAAAATAGSGKPQKPEEVFNSIKSLIIKSADIVNAYYDEISQRLSGEYVAESTFGQFRQATEAAITQNSEGITQAYSNIQNITSHVAEISDAVIEVNAYIKTGLLYYDATGAPVYGVEIGQQTEKDGSQVFQKHTRLIPGRLSFYDQNDIEVAYISDYQLHITQAEVGQLSADVANVPKIIMGDYMWIAGGDGTLTLT